MGKFSIANAVWFLLIVEIFLVSAENPDETGIDIEGDILGVSPSLYVGNTRAGIRNERFRWPNATIPYEIGEGYPGSTGLLRRAMRTISRQTCVKFVPRTNEPDFINMVSGRGCSSYVGRIGGKQMVSLSGGCQYLGTIMHELIHALGFFHEQSRSDRDEYVTIHYENIKPGMERNFYKHGSSYVSNFGTAYDYDSVMHYSRTAFGIDGKDTVVPKMKSASIGKRDGLSAGDVAKINNMYCKGNDKNTNAEMQRQLKLF